MFYQWLKEEDNPAKEIEPPKYKPEKLTTTDKLYWGDVIKLSKGATNKRDFLLPQFLFDTAARIEEVLTLRLKDIEVMQIKDKDGEPKKAAKVHIRKSKTETRSPIIYKSVGALLDWMDDEHPGRSDPTDPLFCKLREGTQPLIYKQVRVILLKLKKQCGLKKQVNPHFFRKSGAFHCADIDLSDSQIAIRLGLGIGTRVLKNYVYPDEDEANNAYLKGEGGRKTEKRKEKHKPLLCWHCNTLNPLGREYCKNPKCRMPLKPKQSLIDDRERVREIVLEVMSEFMQVPEIDARIEKYRES